MVAQPLCARRVCSRWADGLVSLSGPARTLLLQRQLRFLQRSMKGALTCSAASWLIVLLHSSQALLSLFKFIDIANAPFIRFLKQFEESGHWFVTFLSQPCPWLRSLARSRDCAAARSRFKAPPTRPPASPPPPRPLVPTSGPGRESQSTDGMRLVFPRFPHGAL